MSIPKIIHLMWFSGDKYPNSVQRCLDSWKRVLPDFKIMVWDAEKARKLDFQFINDALAARKWAFAADVVRLYALYEYGGVYMDSDVFVKRRFDEYMNNAVSLFQEYHPAILVKGQINSDGSRCEEIADHITGCGIQAAFMISEPKQQILKDILENYKNYKFETDKNGNVKNKLIAPDVYALQCEQYGYKYFDSEQELIVGTTGEKVKIYPSKFIAGCIKYDNELCFAVHECAHGWYDYSFVKGTLRKILLIVRRFKRIFILKQR